LKNNKLDFENEINYLILSGRGDNPDKDASESTIMREILEE
jgi:hypothetical protein